MPSLQKRPEHHGLREHPTESTAADPSAAQDEKFPKAQMSDLGAFLQLLKPSPRLYAAVLITTSALLLLPDRVLKPISLDVFVSQHRPIIAIAALGSAALL